MKDFVEKILYENIFRMRDSVWYFNILADQILCI